MLQLVTSCSSSWSACVSVSFFECSSSSARLSFTSSSMTGISAHADGAGAPAIVADSRRMIALRIGRLRDGPAAEVGKATPPARRH